MARSTHSSAPQSRSISPAQGQQSIHTSRNRSVGTSSRSSLRSTRSLSRDASTPCGNSSTSAHAAHRSGIRTAANVNNIVEISSDSSDDDAVVAVGPSRTLPPRASNASSDFFEVSNIRRAPPAAPTRRSDLFSPPPPTGRPAEPIRFDSSRPIGASVDPQTGDFLTRPMPVVRPRNITSTMDPDDSFSVISAQSAPQPPPRSEHPITDQRLRSSNLAMPTRSPPRSKPPPIEHPLLSTYTCPICFDAPKNLSVTPCGHFFCGDCLFQALKTQAIQRGAMEEEDSLFTFGGLFAPFAPASLYNGAGAAGPGAQANGGGRGGRGGAAGGPGAARGRGGGGRGSAAGGGRTRNKPDPLAGQCPVCRAKIKGAFNGREKNGVVGLRLTMGKPINDPREESGKMKNGPTEADAETGSSSGSSDAEDEVTLPTAKRSLLDTLKAEEEEHAGEGAAQDMGDTSPTAKRRKRRASTDAPGGPLRRSARTQDAEAEANQRP